MDINKLLYALDDTTNENLINLTTKKINSQNLEILQELHLEKDIMINYLNKLKGYRYIDELQDLKYGGFIKWVPITDPKYLPLHYCGIICEIKIIDDGVLIKCKNFMHRYYTFKMDECLIFQKLSTQEQIIINALDHLENEEKTSSQEDDNDEDNDNEDDNEDDE